MWTKAFVWYCIENSKMCILLVWHSEASPDQICLVSRELSSSDLATLVNRQASWDFMWQAYTLFETDCIPCSCFVLYYLPCIRDVQYSNDLDNCLRTNACLYRKFYNRRSHSVKTLESTASNTTADYVSLACWTSAHADITLFFSITSIYSTWTSVTSDWEILSDM